MNSIKMDLNILDINSMVWDMVREYFIIKMEDIMMVIGNLITCMDMVNYNIILGTLYYSNGKPAYKGSWN